MDEKSRGVLKVLGVIGLFVGLISGGIEIFNFFFTPIDTGTAILAIAPCAGVVVIVVLGMILYAERSRPRLPDTSRRVSQVAEPKDTEAKRDRVFRETSRLPGKARWIIAIVLAFLYNVITLLIFFLMSDSTTMVTLDVCVWPVILYAILSYIGLWLGGMAPNRSLAWKWGAGAIYALGAFILLLLSGDLTLTFLGPLFVVPCGLIGGWIGGWLKDNIGTA